jgi:hypothetical protein
MQFKTSFIAAFAALAAVTQASYHVAADTEDGHYRVQLDANGNALGEPINISDVSGKIQALRLFLPRSSPVPKSLRQLQRLWHQRLGLRRHYQRAELLV